MRAHSSQQFHQMYRTNINRCLMRRFVEEVKLRYFNVSLINHLNATYNEAHLWEHLSNVFSTQNNLCAHSKRFYLFIKKNLFHSDHLNGPINVPLAILNVHFCGIEFERSDGEL